MDMIAVIGLMTRIATFYRHESPSYRANNYARENPYRPSLHQAYLLGYPLRWLSHSDD